MSALPLRADIDSPIYGCTLQFADRGQSLIAGLAGYHRHH
jgi:hypothetical protein